MVDLADPDEQLLTLLLAPLCTAAGGSAPPSGLERLKPDGAWDSMALPFMASRGKTVECALQKNAKGWCARTRGGAAAP